MKLSGVFALVLGLGACSNDNPDFGADTTGASTLDGSAATSAGEGGSVSTVSTSGTTESSSETTTLGSSEGGGSSSGVTTGVSGSTSDAGGSEGTVGESTSVASSEGTTDASATTGGVSTDCVAVDDCAADEFCDFPEESPCGWNAQMPGVCVPRPENCNDPGPGPVTGCDCGPLYANACLAQQAGFDYACVGEPQCC